MLSQYVKSLRERYCAVIALQPLSSYVSFLEPC